MRTFLVCNTVRRAAGLSRRFYRNLLRLNVVAQPPINRFAQEPRAMATESSTVNRRWVVGRNASIVVSSRGC